MLQKPKALVFSDLDGTLLDHRTYSWRAANAALTRMRFEGVGLILATSKTASEVVSLREEIGFADYPAIVENGGGILPASGTALPTESSYKKLRDILSRLPSGFVGFGDMTFQQVSELSGLKPEIAVKARDRAFSEPGIWTGPSTGLSEFITSAKDAGLLVQQGGRFLTLSFGGTKADRVEELIKTLSPDTTIALGDAPNDIEMLMRTDYGVIVANSAGPTIPRLPGEKTGRIRRTIREGPEGWSEAILEFLDAMPKKR